MEFEKTHGGLSSQEKKHKHEDVEMTDESSVESNNESEAGSDNESGAASDNESDDGSDDEETFWENLRSELMDELASEGNASDVTLRDAQKRLYELYRNRVVEYELIRKDPLHKQIIHEKRRLEDDKGLEFEDAIHQALKIRRRQILREAGVDDEFLVELEAAAHGA